MGVSVWLEFDVSHYMQHRLDDTLLFSVCVDGKAQLETIGYFISFVLPVQALCTVYAVRNAGNYLFCHVDSLLWGGY